MRRSLWLLPLSFCVLLGLLAWLGIRLANQERAGVEDRYRLLLTGQLAEVNRQIANWLDALQRDLTVLADQTPLDTEQLRRLARTDPRVEQTLLLTADHLLQHPPPPGQRNLGELGFLGRVGELLLDKDLTTAAGGEDVAETTRTGATTPVKTYRAPGQSGWQAWYWGRGLHLIFWRRLADGRVLGIALPRARWMADMIASLPDSGEPAAELPRRTRLIDSQGRLVYQWGTLPDEPADSGSLVSLASLPLSDPLSAWRLECDLPRGSLEVARRSLRFNLLAGLGAAGAALAGLAVLVCREQLRESREARQRVNFVNQVSHELKTPLTNIRMYADLLEGDLQGAWPAGSKPEQRLDVIVSESQRLTRLINNVLAFAQHQKGRLQLRPRLLDPQPLIEDVVQRFEPLLQRRGIKVRLQVHSAEPLWLDESAVEQILGNLLGNIEKHAAGAAEARVELRSDGSRLQLIVADDGAGLPDSLGQRVFEPFVRGPDNLESAAGAGIGLSIIRQLARLHGGDVRLQTGANGAIFEVWLQSLIEGEPPAAGAKP